MEKGKNEKALRTGRSYRELLISRAKKRKSSENGVEKKDNVTEEDQNVTEEHENATEEDQNVTETKRVGDEREKQTGSSDKNGKEGTEIFKSQVAVDRTDKSNCMGSRQDGNFSANECKCSTPKFVEYWVPVKLSNEQIEQYCDCLLTNSAWLRSCLKDDPSSYLCDILASTRKCCDHPYLEDRSLREKVIEGIPEDQHLDAEIKLSGKLEFLNKILQEIKQQGQRVLILFRTIGGSGVISLGDILDDFIHQKFGEDSYMRIFGNVCPKKKKDTLNKFNNKESSKFACLMDTRHCVPSVKLSGIDTVVFYNSDWDPTNDLRSMQKIKIDSQLEHIKVFRLYSRLTVEEKALILAKEGLTVESNTMDIKQAACHELLTWGASYLFHEQSSKLNESSEDASLDDVFTELLTIMSSNSENSDYNSCSKISKVQQNGRTNSRKISLLGELEMKQMDCSSFGIKLMENEPPSIFWTNLLFGRGKHLSTPSQGSRRKVRIQGDYQPSKREQVSEEKARKEGNNVQLSPPPKLRMNGKWPVQGKRRKVGMSHLSADNKHKRRRLVTNPTSIDSNQPLDTNTSAPTDCGQAQVSAPTDSHQQHSNCVDSSDHQVLDSLDLGCSSPVESFIQQSTGVNDASMRSINNQQDQCHPDASPTAAELPQSPCLHTLQIVMDGIQKEREQNMKFHEDMKLQLRSAFENDLDAITKKYDLLLQIAEVELDQKLKALDTIYNKVHEHKLLAEHMAHMQSSADTAGSLEMTEGTGQSSPSRPNSVQASTLPASRSSDILKYPSLVTEPVNSEQRGADCQRPSEYFPRAATPFQIAELPRARQSAEVPPTGSWAILQTESSANLPTSGGSRVTPSQSSLSRPSSVPVATALAQPASQSSDDLNNSSLVSEPVISEQRGADCQKSSETFPMMAATPYQNSELPVVGQLQRTCARATPQTVSFAGLPRNGSHVTPSQSSLSRPSSFPAETSSTLPAGQSSDVLKYPSLVSKPVNSEQQVADRKRPFENFLKAATPFQIGELPLVRQLAEVPPPGAWATLQTVSLANLPKCLGQSGSRVTPSHSTPSKPCTVRAVTASTLPASQSSDVLKYPSLVSEPVNSEQQVADRKRPFEIFLKAATPFQIAELPLVRQSAELPLPGAWATLQTESLANLLQSGSCVTPSNSTPGKPCTVRAVTASTLPASQSSDVLKYPSLVSDSTQQQGVVHQRSSKNFPIAATPFQTAVLPVRQSEEVPLTYAATLQTGSLTNLPTSGSSVIPTQNLQPVILSPVLSTSLPTQLPIQNLSYAARPGPPGSFHVKGPAPHLRHVRPLPSLNSLNSSLLQR